MLFRDYFKIEEDECVIGKRIINNTSNTTLTIQAYSDTCIKFIDGYGKIHILQTFGDWHYYDLAREHGAVFYIEGVDSVGKATQTKLLKDKLEENGEDVLVFSYPNYESICGKFIKEYLNGSLGDAGDVLPKLIGAFYALDRAADMASVRSHYEEGGVVIMDRSPYSNAAFQGSKGKTTQERLELFDWFIELEFGHLNMQKPTAVFFLDAEPAVARELMATRAASASVDAEGKQDQHESNESMLQLAHALYRVECEANEKWHSLNVVEDGVIRTPQSIADSIYEKVELHLY